MSLVDEVSVIPELTLLGQARLACPGRAPFVLGAKYAALLALLQLDGPQPRARLCALLWPESSPERAVTSLRKLRERLQDKAGQVLQLEADGVLLHPRLTSDVGLLEQLSPQQLLASGELLASLDFSDLEDFSDWLHHARRRTAERMAQILAERAEGLEQKRELHEALQLASRIVQLTPDSEHAARRLMRLHYLRGDCGAALAACDALCERLLHTRRTQPSPETRQLRQTIEAAQQAQKDQSSPHRRPVPASVMLPPLLVGRESAWLEMSSAWQQGQPIVLLGEAGMGKSRLLQEFLRGRGGVVSDKARAGDACAPYAVLGRVLLQVKNAHPTVVSVTTQRELARVRPEFGSPWPGKAQTHVLWTAIEHFLAQAADQGLQAIVLDDMHAADAASLDALRWLARSPALNALRWALALRPLPSLPDSPLPQAQWLDQWCNDSQPPARVLLTHLSEAGLAALLASLALPGLVDPVVTAHLFRHAGGHPFYTLATLQDALTHGHDLRRARLPDPPSVQALLDARLRELSPSTQALLHVAAVAGADLSIERAAAMLSCEPLDLVEPWRHLEEANVLRGEGFTHDLVHDAALRCVPLGVRLGLHRQMGALLAKDPRATPARVAWQWEAGERWAEAGACWHAAGLAARLAGRLIEQTELFESAARCYQRAGDAGARFEALFARLDGLQLRSGGAAVLEALPELLALADTSLQRLRCQLVRAEAYLDTEQAALALEQATQAVREAADHAQLQADASALLALGLARMSQHESALTAALQAVDYAKAAGDGQQQLRATHALAYVHYAVGRLAAAVPIQRAAMVLAETLGDRAEAAACEGHVAALWASVGHVPNTYEHAQRARLKHQAIGLGNNSALAAVNHIVLGAAAAYLGEFDLAVDELQAAVVIAGRPTAAAAQAKAKLALGNLWLTLGRAAAARELVDDMPSRMPPGMHMQATLVLARAAALDGLPQKRHWQKLAELGAEHAGLPLVNAADYELSFQGHAPTIIQRLLEVQTQCLALGLDGTARSLQLRALTRWLEVEGQEATEALHRHALELAPHIEHGLSAKVYVPEAWLTLANAFGRAGDKARRADCLAHGRQWLDRALRRVPADYKLSFENGNPVNRQLWAGGDQGHLR